MGDQPGAKEVDTAMRQLRLVPLTRDRAAQAYPLIQTVRPSMSLSAWTRYVSDVLDAGADGSGGIATLQDPRGLIAGLFVYRIAHTPDHGRTLVAKDFVALDIVDSTTVLNSLADALEQTARDYDCRAVHTSIACERTPPPNGIVELMCRLGHRVEGVHLCKPLTASG